MTLGIKGFQKGHKIWLGKKLSTEAKLKISSYRKGKKMPVYLKEKLSSIRLSNPNTPRKEKHWNWQGGITPKNKALRRSHEFKLWREAVFKRDKYTCIWCGIKGNETGGYLEADHIKQFAYYPELRFAIDNGRTLCKPCHRKTDTFAKKQKLCTK